MNIDLSNFHKQLNAEFAQFGDVVSNALTPAQVGFFNENGYLAEIDLLSRPQIDILRTELSEIMSPEMSGDPRFYEYNQNESSDPSKVLFHALGAWRVSEAFHDLIFLPRLAACFRQLLGGQPRFWHDQVFVKPANDGAVVAWHQDYSYWTRTVPNAHITCWIGLDDSTVENGCVHYIPGSHRWPLLPRGGLSDDMESIFEHLSDEQKSAFKPVAIELKAGQVSFHHSMTVHGSYENRSPRPRRAAVINVFRDGVMSDSDEPLLAGVPTIAPGEKIDGQFFPLLG
ncbi:MAG: phytanoyl-CoA dioxygenase family protein [Pyrinomonadaceae bacterium]